jgi:hypothetical protein
MTQITRNKVKLQAYQREYAQAEASSWTSKGQQSGACGTGGTAHAEASAHGNGGRTAMLKGCFWPVRLHPFLSFKPILFLHRNQGHMYVHSLYAHKRWILDVLQI